LSYASSGAATPHHLFMEMFLKMVGAKAQHVPYRGSVPALTDVISGHIPFMIVDLAVAIPAINEGKVKALGVTSTSRIKAMPDLPTIAESGVPGYGGTPWFSVVAPAGTPRPIIDRLNQVLMAFISRPETQDKMNALAITPWTSTPDELAQFIPAEIEKCARTPRVRVRKIKRAPDERTCAAAPPTSAGAARAAARSPSAPPASRSMSAWWRSPARTRWRWRD
jgi:tripartite-type tricarboxylate transporter receptor subunit TctC